VKAFVVAVALLVSFEILTSNHKARPAPVSVSHRVETNFENLPKGPVEYLRPKPVPTFTLNPATLDLKIDWSHFLTAERL